MSEPGSQTGSSMNQEGSYHWYDSDVDIREDDSQTHYSNESSFDGMDEDESQFGDLNDQRRSDDDVDVQGLSWREGSDVGMSDRGSSISDQVDQEGSDDSVDVLVQGFPPYRPDDLEAFGRSVVALTMAGCAPLFPHHRGRFMDTFRRLQHLVISTLSLHLRTFANREYYTRLAFAGTCNCLSNELSPLNEEMAMMTDVEQVFDYILTTLNGEIRRRELYSGYPNTNPPLQEVRIDSSFLPVSQDASTQDDNHLLIPSVRFPTINSCYSPYSLTLSGNALTDDILRRRINDRNLILKESTMTRMYVDMRRNLRSLVEKYPSIISGPPTTAHRRNFDEEEMRNHLGRLITDEVRVLIAHGDQDGTPISASNLELIGPWLTELRVGSRPGSEETQSSSRVLSMQLYYSTPVPQLISDRLFLRL
ncbi:hypothetical protein BCR39DRAFT_534731 [Naematelia encephala]|uniref:Uncharacterized protein n=1 Tax=Naematelia encephala TaxID=71784 RepID=A0A1Y2B0W6_9TREE|nr:hypothetical protein BCR39DRAFT_534731 [Naematelia encephala]